MADGGIRLDEQDMAPRVAANQETRRLLFRILDDLEIRIRERRPGREAAAHVLKRLDAFCFGPEARMSERTIAELRRALLNGELRERSSLLAEYYARITEE